MSPSTAACPPWNPNSVFFFYSLTVTELAVNLSWDSRFKPVLGRLATGSCSWTYSGSLCSAVFSKSFFRLNDGVPLERNNTNNSSKTASRNMWRFHWLSNQPRLYSNRWSFNKFGRRKFNLNIYWRVILEMTLQLQTVGFLGSPWLRRFMLRPVLKAEELK